MSLGTISNGAIRRSPRTSWRPSSRLSLVLLATAALVAMPVLALVWHALSPQPSSIWPHLAANVLPGALLDTTLLLAGVGIVCTVIGVTTAWLVTQYDFAGRRGLEWLLVLPLALPTYLVAYIYVEILGFSGPFQTALRAVTGYRTLRDYWFPDPRNMLGAVLIMGLVLYPYVYLTTRALFGLQSAEVMDSARTLGGGPRRLFWRIGLPLARPALAVGLTLALLETMNDIGATEYLAVRSLTLSIYTTWLNRGSLAGAAQIACVMLAIVVVLMLIEAKLRGQRRFTLSVRRPRPCGRTRLRGGAAALAATVCATPVMLGALLPAGFLVWEILSRDLLAGAGAPLASQVFNTVLLSAIASSVVVVLGFTIVLARRRETIWPTHVLMRASTLGYALPGTVLALGLLSPVAGIDNAIADAVRSLFGGQAGLVLIGSGAALVIAYTVRFLAIAINGIDSGMTRISTRIDDAARALGAGTGEVARRLHWPLMRPAIAAAALLVFVDCLKELPATLLLRPLNVETLATVVYAEASRGTFEEGAVAALLIILAGIYPTILLAHMGGARDLDKPANQP